MPRTWRNRHLPSHDCSVECKIGEVRRRPRTRCTVDFVFQTVAENRSERASWEKVCIAKRKSESANGNLENFSFSPFSELSFEIIAPLFRRKMAPTIPNTMRYSASQSEKNLFRNGQRQSDKKSSTNPLSGAGLVDFWLSFFSGNPARLNGFLNKPLFFFLLHFIRCLIRTASVRVRWERYRLSLSKLGEFAGSDSPSNPHLRSFHFIPKS